MSRYEKTPHASRIVPDDDLESVETWLKIFEEVRALRQEGVLSERLNSFMGQHGLTSRAAAKLLDISYSYISKLKLGLVDGANAGKETLIKIASFTADYPRVPAGRSKVEIWQSFPPHKHRSQQQSRRSSGRA